MIEEVAPGLLRIGLPPLEIVNAYLLGDVLIDSGMRWFEPSLLKSFAGRQLRAHAVTHAHPDHQGASHAVCEKFVIPLYCGEADRQALESGNLATTVRRPSGLTGRVAAWTGGPGHSVARCLSEGDEVGGFTVLETPGHTAGHLAFWRASDRALVLGDVLFNRNPVTLRHGLCEPFSVVTWDSGRNRASAKKLASLEPEIICFGHGRPLFDGAQLCEFVAGLPDD